MVSAKKVKAKDDFVLTLSDNEDDANPELEVVPASSESKNKKRKRDNAAGSKDKLKKAKKEKNVEVDEEEEGNDGVWGAKEDDDGAMDSDFEFQLEAADRKSVV